MNYPNRWSVLQGNGTDTAIKGLDSRIDHDVQISSHGMQPVHLIFKNGQNKGIANGSVFKAVY